MVNMIRKAPKKQDSEKLTVRYGSMDTTEGILEATGSVSPSTYYILTLAQFNRAADQDWFHIRRTRPSSP